MYENDSVACNMSNNSIVIFQVDNSTDVVCKSKDSIPLPLSCRLQVMYVERQLLLQRRELGG